MNDFIDELLLKVFSYCDVETLDNISCVCKHWNIVSNSQILWKEHVLKKWPSQKWLYEKAGANELNWKRIYEELMQHLWYSLDQMKYFVTCDTIANELVSPTLRQAMFTKIESVSKKWCQVTACDHDGSSQTTNKNMELFFNLKSLEWCFLDKRRGYLSDLFTRRNNKRTFASNNKQSYYIRSYQVIPSCLVMYRWLCIFRSLVTEETGLTFYRVWRFRLKHLETGLIFELSDWKAAMSSTLAKGRPEVASFHNDCLELLQLLTHPHFIMHPFGLDARAEKLFNSMIKSSAGGCLNTAANKRRKRRNPLQKRASPLLSPTTGKPFKIGKLKENACYVDISDRLEKWRARRKCALDSPTLQNKNAPECSLAVPQLDGELSRASSSGSLLSETSTTTDESQLETASSDSEMYGNGYVTNCEYFIANSHSYDSIEEQHNLQAGIADLWLFSRSECTEKVALIYDIDDASWSFQSEVHTQEVDKNILVESIPSALMLYRLVCLFELNCSMYSCFDDCTVWRVKLMHIKTGGVLHLCDYNGLLKVFVSLKSILPPEEPLAESFDGVTDFRAACTQLLDLLMDENFCHPYGTIAGAVA